MKARKPIMRRLPLAVTVVASFAGSVKIHVSPTVPVTEARSALEFLSARALVVTYVS